MGGRRGWIEQNSLISPSIISCGREGWPQESVVLRDRPRRQGIDQGLNRWVTDKDQDPPGSGLNRGFAAVRPEDVDAERA